MADELHERQTWRDRPHLDGARHGPVRIRTVTGMRRALGLLLAVKEMDYADYEVCYLPNLGSTADRLFLGGTGHADRPY